MPLSQRIAIAVAEAGLPHDQCMSCERQGLPILPLRRALVPDARPGCVTTVAGSLHVSTKMGLRTLRMGYLYVLLDQQVWHAYEVSEQGHLRRFNPYEPSDGLPAPLPEKCVNENHDIPSSFLNIDTDRYGSAWLAFSSDPWPVSVLNAYKRGTAPAHRFEGLDLTQARNNPELLGIAMTPDNLQIDKEVFEYAQHGCSPFDSAHGFYTRWLRRFVKRQIWREEAHAGVSTADFTNSADHSRDAPGVGGTENTVAGANDRRRASGVRGSGSRASAPGRACAAGK